MKKVCRTCQVEKPLSGFHRNKRTKGGHLNTCKECRKADCLSYYAENADRLRGYARGRYKTPEAAAARKVYEQTQERKAARIRNSRHYEVRSPIKTAARVQVRDAIRRGLIERQPCESCGASRAQAHHDNYGKPLDVRWLCTTHHAEWHKHNTPLCPDQEIAA